MLTGEDPIVLEGIKACMPIEPELIEPLMALMIQWEQYQAAALLRDYKLTRESSLAA